MSPGHIEQAETAEEMEDRLKVWEQRLQRWEHDLRHKSAQMRTEAALNLRLPLEARAERAEGGRGLVDEEAALQMIADKLRDVEAMRNIEEVLVVSNASTNSQTPRHTAAGEATSDAATTGEVASDAAAESSPSQALAGLELSEPILEEALVPTTPRGKSPADTPWSTPEMPARELPAEQLDMAHAADFFSRHLPSPMAAAVGQAQMMLLPSSPQGNAAPHEQQQQLAMREQQQMMQMAQLQAPPPPQQQAASSAPPFWYRVAFIGGISVREAPDAVALVTGLTLPCNEVFGVSERLQGVDHRVYLRLATGLGWVFDDAALYPDDPAVQELPPGAASPASAGSGAGASPVLSTIPSDQQQQSMMPSPNPGLTGAAPPAASNRPLPMGYNPDPGPSNSTCLLPVTMSGDANSATFFVDSNATYASPSSSAATDAAAALTWYRVSFLGGISVREFPDVDAPRSGVTLPLGEVFGATERIMGNDQRLYLRLADGRGWVFDDTLLCPEDSSVMPIHSAPALVAHGYENCDVHMEEGYDPQWQYGSTAMDHTMDYGQLRQKQYWARGCRGGAKRNKWKKEQARLTGDKVSGGAADVGSASSSKGSGAEDSNQTDRSPTSSK